MPFKHTVTDNTGKVHTRTSASRQYTFAVVRFWSAYNTTGADSEIFIPAGSCASWCSRRDLAEKEANKYRGSQRFQGAEIIPCTPVATGKHAKVPA